MTAEEGGLAAKSGGHLVHNWTVLSLWQSTDEWFIPLWDKTINPIHQKACEPFPYPITHVFVRCKTMSTNVYLEHSKNVQIACGEIWAVERMWLLSCSDTRHSRNLSCHSSKTIIWHAVSAVYSCYATMNFPSSYSFRSNNRTKRRCSSLPAFTDTESIYVSLTSLPAQ